MVVAHVVDAEDVEVGVLRDAFLDVGVKAERELFAFLLGLGCVNDFGALRLRHYGYSSVKSSELPVDGQELGREVEN